jgi:CHAT domain-containing protein
VVARKGRTLDVIAAGRKSAGTPDDRAARSDLARLVLLGPRALGIDPQQYPARMQELQAVVDKSSAASSIKPLPPDLLDRVVASLSVGDVLVELYLHRPQDPRTGSFGPSRYLALVLQAHAAPRWVDLGAAAPVDALASTFRDALVDARREVATPARALRRVLIDPLRLPADGTRILFSPDGTLNVVPLEALEDDDGTRLVARLDVAYLSSARDVLEPAPTSGADGDTLVIADPAFGNPKWTRLPGTQAEAEAIRARFPGAVIKTGDQATKAALHAVARPAVLHLATHGFFVTDAQWFVRDGSALALRGLTLDSPPVLTGASVDPLARAGVLLAPSGGDEGILSALEIASEDRHDTRLVVLSACETGLGEVEPGQGIYGLRRALVLAGVRNQVLSLWKVDDDATRDLMAAFYDGLRRGEPAGRALRKAQLALMQHKETSHPFFWAAFVASGDPGPAPAPPAKVATRMASARGCACNAPGRDVDDASGSFVACAILAALAWSRTRARRADGE